MPGGRTGRSALPRPAGAGSSALVPIGRRWRYEARVSFRASRDRALLSHAAAALGADVSDEQLEGLASFAELVATWNTRVNLTGAKDPRALVDVLFADAFVLAHPRFVAEGARVVDVGAGAGAPALPLALLRPDVHVTLVEPRRLRAAFVRTAIGALALEARASGLERRMEGPPLEGAPFDVALSRATFEPAAWLERGRALAPRVLVLCGTDPLPAGELLESREYALPFGGSPRRVGLYAR